MSQSLLLPAFVALFGVVAALFLLGFAPAAPEPRRSDPVDEYWDDDDYVDDDHYVEFTVTHDHPEPVTAVAAAPPPPIAPVAPAAPVADVRAIEDEGDTEPMAARHRGHHVTPKGRGTICSRRPRITWHDEAAEPTEPRTAHRREPVRSLSDFLADVPPPKPSVEPIGFAHNGFHVDDQQRFQPLSHFEAREEPPAHAAPPKPDILRPDYPLDIGSHAHHESPDEAGFERPSRHGLADHEPTSNGRHSRTEPDDATSRGRHYRQGD